MNIPRKRWSTFLAVSVALAAPTAGRSADLKPVADADLKDWVDQRVKERQPTTEDRRFDQIGWFKDIRTAEKLAQEHHRLLFLFTHDGRMNVGRC
jgi:hypothetical protein